MKFSLKLKSGNGCRLGVLSRLRSNPEIIYDTPLSLTITKNGSVPHLTKDNYEKTISETSPVCIPVQHFADLLDVLKSYKQGVTKFVSLQSHPACIVIHDPTQPILSGYNDGASVSVWGSTGRMKLTAEKYHAVISLMRPDWYECLNDSDTTVEASKKRVQKSKNNSAQFLEKCLQLHKSNEEMKDVGIFCPLLGGWNPFDRKKWSERVSNEDVEGFMISGLATGDVTAEDLDSSRLMQCVQASLEGIPDDKIRQIQGAFSLLSILELIEAGVDIFDSSLPYLATERGCALFFPNTLDQIAAYDTSTHNLTHGDSPLDASEEAKIANENKMSGKKKRRTDSLDKPSTNDIDCLKENEPLDSEGGLAEAEEMKILHHYEIDLNDKRYFDSKEPLMENCECYTCKAFSRAYIHHLLSVREMLGSVLLMIHNLHHWELLFRTFREAIKLDRFDKLKQFFIDYHRTI